MNFSDFVGLMHAASFWVSPHCTVQWTPLSRPSLRVTRAAHIILAYCLLSELKEMLSFTSRLVGQVQVNDNKVVIFPSLRFHSPHELPLGSSR